MKATAFICLLLFLYGCTDDAPVRTESRDTVVPKAAVPVRQQVNPYAPVDVSPLDISYFPADYPVARMRGTATAMPFARVLYSRPHRQGRTIFGNLLQYGQPWRLGANEATELELFRDATVGGKHLAKGRYMMYCIPYADHWTIIFNRNLYSWGLTQDGKQDLFKVDMPVTKGRTTLEYFTMVFETAGSNTNLLMAWEDVEVRLPVTFQK